MFNGVRGTSFVLGNIVSQWSHAFSCFEKLASRRGTAAHRNQIMHRDIQTSTIRGNQAEENQNYANFWKSQDLGWTDSDLLSGRRLGAKECLTPFLRFA